MNGADLAQVAARPGRKAWYRNMKLATAGATALAVGLAVPAYAGGGDTSDMPGQGQACGTLAGNGTTTCSSSIQTAISDAGPGGTVNVGPGHFDEHLVITDGVTLRGSGNSTVIDGALDTPLISVSGTPSSPVTVENLTIQASSGTGPGYLMTLKDRNPANLDSVTNVSFLESQPSQRDYGIYNENSTATVAVTNDTFRGMAVGMIIDVYSSSGSGRLGADLVQGNLFDHLANVVKPPKGIDISINSDANAAGAQIFTGNTFNFDGGTAVQVDGSTFNGAISAHDNRFKGQDFGVKNGSSDAVDATDSWWGCPGGPTGTQGGCAHVSGDVSYTPWLTH